MKTFRIYQIDAFTRERFAGNSAGVVANADGLTDSQMQSYAALKEQVIMDALDNLAAIKLMNIQDQIGFSDEQLKKLTPVLGESMRGLIKIAWKYAGERRIRLGEKIRIARELKEIQHKSEREVKQILTPDQYEKWEAYKKQQQGK